MRPVRSLSSPPSEAAGTASPLLAIGRLAAPVVLVHGALLATWDLGGHPIRTVTLLALGVAAVAWAAIRCERVGAISPLALLAVAVLLRALLLPLPPTLSDDVLRYVWDGRVLSAGFDPYRLAPEATQLEPLRDELWERLPHRQVPTVYPPLALVVFGIASRSPAPILTLKLLLSLADLVGCALLVWLAARLGLPTARAVWYAWNPLVVLEVAGMGHVEGLGVVACLAAVALLADRPARQVAAGVAAAAAILAKLVPFVAFPAWVKQSPRPTVFAGVALVLVTLACAPFLLSGGIPQGHVTFGISWEFNGPFWEPLWRVLDHLDAPLAVESVLDSLKQWWGHAGLWNRLYPYNYPQLQAKAALAVALVLVLPLIWRRQDPVSATGAAFGALLLCSATVYPWYLLWILPWAALARQPAWLLLSATLPLAYLPQFTHLSLMPWIFLGIWSPFFLALLGWPRWSIA